MTGTLVPKELEQFRACHLNRLNNAVWVKYTQLILHAQSSQKEGRHRKFQKRARGGHIIFKITRERHTFFKNTRGGHVFY